MSKLVFGVGINDGSRPVKVDGKPVKEYVLWAGMLKRCFYEKYQNKRPTYKGCNVSDNFLNYAFFYNWCQEQIGFGNVDDKGHSWCLDKDILFVGNKTYSEATCIFVPNEINVFFTDSRKARGDCPQGVSFDTNSGKYKAYCKVDGRLKHLGLFLNKQDAFLSYKPFKEALCKQLALKWKDEIDHRVYEAMMKWEVDITS